MAQQDTKSIRLQVLVDKPFKKMVDQAAHDSWMSVGQYMRDIVVLMDGANYDNAADLVMIGKEVGIDGLAQLRLAAERRGVTVGQFCLSIAKRKEAGEPSAGGAEAVRQESLF